MRRKKALLATGAAVFSMALLGTAGQGASADEDGRRTVAVAEVAGKDAARKMAQQRPLVAAADVIRWAQERGRFAGFTGIALERGRVALYWKGALPARMREAVAEARGTARVRIVTAPYSLKELKTASARLQERLRAEPSLGHTVKIPADGSGLVVAADPVRGAAAAAPRTAAALEGDLGVPVRTIREGRMKERSRDNDSHPWSGGALIKINGVPCSSGFGVRNGSGAQYVLTAAHCGQPGGRTTNGADQYIGTVGPRHQPHDVMLIPTSDVDDFMYTGAWGDERGVRVDGWDWVYTGEYLCQSGVTSAAETGGPVCNLKVKFFYNDTEDLVEAEQMNGQAAARGGDSGGPVYAASANGGAIAKGTVTRSLGSGLGFQDFGTAWRDFGVWIDK
ncbi:Serine protease 2 [Streptomyces sp. YIM 121038]|uniref:trypsin-like serine protease n=1 Tax=Streptomyces sp. YIM 121038 TaxID=2136401 RepID=UPI001110537D|nr:trypsin-like serine protease [Streptomyces sp. YIM 121038]QCX74766.1 Serine protease 2 [Streptomyces sp. YIM 121038]